MEIFKRIFSNFLKYDKDTFDPFKPTGEENDSQKLNACDLHGNKNGEKKGAW